MTWSYTTLPTIQLLFYNISSTYYDTFSSCLSTPIYYLYPAPTGYLPASGDQRGRSWTLLWPQQDGPKNKSKSCCKQSQSLRSLAHGDSWLCVTVSVRLDARCPPLWFVGAKRRTGEGLWNMCRYIMFLFHRCLCFKIQTHFIDTISIFHPILLTFMLPSVLCKRVYYGDMLVCLSMCANSFVYV